MRPCRCARDGPAEGQEGNAAGAEMVEQGATLDAVRMQRDVHGIPMIEAQPIVQRRLPQGAHRKGPPEPHGEELREARDLIYGQYYTTAYDDSEPEEFVVKSVR